MEQEFIEMINGNRGTIFKVCNLYCHEDENRKDLVQEIILQLWKSYASFRNEANINTWVYRVALNTAISNFRKESKKPGKTSLTDAIFQLPDIAQSADEKEKISMLNNAIGRLTEIEKAVIMLYLDEKTYDEIAEILGIDNNQLKVKHHRAKQKLIKLLNESSL